ncbi:hypothetical protein [Brumimicrobium oceani]|uniref:DUF4168 domain-containing protein n=1 Tax=Brumimicrobium oceani TaxID=2100725 RepID=A0A2U2XGZ2_9FLAO|nr:hypothetical protein [Brumimicrobium oceani]PWH87066.1 hypothetical protein DIT68_02050 [Brumimicrobium oceani]
MKKVFILVSWLFLIQLELIAQDQNDRSQIIEQTNTKALNEFASKKSSQYARFSKKAIEQGIPTEILNKKMK